MGSVWSSGSLGAASRAAAAISFQALRALVDDVIVPELVDGHTYARRLSPDIDPFSAELARLLLAADPTAAFALIDRLRADGRSIPQLCAGLFEPAARALGDLWQSEDCGALGLPVGLGHLQLALRRASLESPPRSHHSPGCAPHAVLVAPSPQEPHVLGSVIASEMFWRAGWDVSCEFPENAAALTKLVHDRWFDVLELSLSVALSREHRLAALAEVIRSAHAHSLNPRLIVIVDGRVFRERPRAFIEVGAEADCASALDLLSTVRYQTRIALQEEAVQAARSRAAGRHPPGPQVNMPRPSTPSLSAAQDAITAG